MDGLPKIVDRVKETGNGITLDEARGLMNLPLGDLDELIQAADQVRTHFRGRRFEMESITNIKSGNCPEDCAFCAQSVSYHTGTETYPLLDETESLARAKRAEEAGASVFCLVAAWREPNQTNFNKLIQIIRRLRKEVSLEIDVSIGFVTDEHLSKLKAAGVTRVNHNMETAPSYFNRLVSTHNWQDRADTVRRVKKSGLQACSGGIVGMGESKDQRIELAIAARDVGVDCFPLNILDPRPGTPLQSNEKLEPMEIIRTIAIFRLIMPKITLKVSGGREVNLDRSHQELAFQAGADSLILGDYLTTQGQKSDQDVEMIKSLGFEIEKPR